MSKRGAVVFESSASASSATPGQQFKLPRPPPALKASRRFAVPVILAILERKPATQLDFASRGHRHSDRSELRRIHEAVRRSQVYFVQRVECFGPELEIGSLADAEGSRQREVHGLQRRAIHGVPAGIAV